MTIRPDRKTFAKLQALSQRAAAAQVVDQHGGVAVAALDHRDEVRAHLQRQPDPADLHVNDPVAVKAPHNGMRTHPGVDKCEPSVPGAVEENHLCAGEAAGMLGENPAEELSRELHVLAALSSGQRAAVRPERKHGHPGYIGVPLQHGDERPQRAGRGRLVERSGGRLHHPVTRTGLGLCRPCGHERGKNRKSNEPRQAPQTRITGLSNCGKANCLVCRLLAGKTGKRLNIRGRTQAQPLSIALCLERTNGPPPGGLLMAPSS